MTQVTIKGKSGHIRSLIPEETLDIDVSAVDYVGRETAGFYIRVITAGNLKFKLIGDAAWHEMAVIANESLDMAFKEISSDSTATVKGFQ